jgi:uncharacterized protein
MFVKKDIIKTLIANQHNKTKHDVLFERTVQLPIHSGKIIVLTGVRRCGKTSLLKIALQKVIDSGVHRSETMYISFDDERMDLQPNELDLIMQAYRELYPDNELKDCYLFFDEIQNIDKWEKFIRRVYDHETKNIFISGSNSKQLGSEIATSLRGRTIQYELFPLSFSEYLDFKKVEKEYYSDKNKAVIISQFYNYLKEGGFPETVLMNSEMSNRILNDYYNVLLFRDIVERYNVTKISALKYFIQKLIVNIGKPFSINKIYNELKSQGIKIDRGYLYDVIEFVEAVYLGHRLYKFDFSVVNREMSDKKLYFIDNGLLNSISFRFSDNYGMLLENLVFLWLRQAFGDNLFYYQQKNECDYVVFVKDKARHCIQVCFDISDVETREREIEGLNSALEYFKLKSGIIITAEHEESIVLNGKTIKIQPAYKIMLNQNPFV